MEYVVVVVVRVTKKREAVSGSESKCTLYAVHRLGDEESKLNPTANSCTEHSTPWLTRRGSSFRGLGGDFCS